MLKRFSIGLTLLVGFLCDIARSEETTPPGNEEAVIRKNVTTYVESFNSQNAKALADSWTPDAVYVNRITGEEVVGRAAIAEQFSELFKARKDLKLEVDVESIRLLSPNAAVENGIAKFTAPGAEVEKINYSAVYVKRDGTWLLDRVTDQATEEPLSNYEQLKSLEWMVGKWVDADENAQIETECKWAKNRNFLVRSFAVSVGDQIEMSGMQVIGWDPIAKTIRSWTFDSDGSFAEATWTNKKDRWFIKNSGVLADGRKASMINVIKQVDDKSFTWQTVERMIGTEIQPSTPEVMVVRE